MSDTIYHALALAAKTRQDAFNESRATYLAHSQDESQSTEARRLAFLLSSVFLSMAKAARYEAEAMLSPKGRQP